MRRTGRVRAVRQNRIYHSKSNPANVVHAPARAPYQAGTLFLGRDAPYDLLWQMTACTHLTGDAALADTPLTVASSRLLPHQLPDCSG
jgi:hypothetical protein